MPQADLIRRIRMVTGNEETFPVGAKGMSHLEQYAHSVLGYSSKYNNSFSVSYAPANLVASYGKYPAYGDFPDTYMLQSYGKWWKESESVQPEYRAQDADPMGAEDYVTVQFESPVVPRDVLIYETYNPGAVVRIWGRFTGTTWRLLWEGPPQICPDTSRKFQPPIKKLNCLINEIRLEFNQSHLKYHTSIDAILLAGYQPVHSLAYSVLEKDLWKNVGHPVETLTICENEGETDTRPDHFSNLPLEIIIHIFKSLDLKSLSSCAQVNRMFYNATLNKVLYQNLSLKRYWNRVKSETLKFFGSRCRVVKKLDLSWCGCEDKLFPEVFVNFISEHCSKYLTHLSLCHCDFINNNVTAAISTCEELTDLRLKNATPDQNGFKHLARLKKLISLDLSSTCIMDEALIMILKANPELKHLNIDLCESMERLDQVVETVANHNVGLRTWSSWKTMTLSSTGAKHFAKLTQLQELDLGWCFVVTDPRDCLEPIANGCPKLKKLILSQWRGLTDQQLYPVIIACKNIEILDLQGIRTITDDICNQLLIALPKLRLLDISFCGTIASEQVDLWRQQYPGLTIQRSCQYTAQDHWN